MKAKITAPLGFRCAPDGHTVVTYAQGAEVHGQIAEWAVAASAGTKMHDPREETKVQAPEETKARGKKGRNK